MSTELDKIEVRPARRRFLKGAAALATTLIAPGVFLYKTGQAASTLNSDVRWGLLIDTNALSEADVDACVSACQREHGWHSESGSRTDAQWVRKIRLTDQESGHQTFLPMMCQHCESPPCVDVCPTGASFKRADGVVLVNKHICIGCRYCMMACPYKARSFIHENLTDQLPTAPRGKGTVESCTLCVHKVDRGDHATACSDACQHDAIIFGDMKNPNERISQILREKGGRELRAELGLNTGIRYQGL